MAVIEGWKGVVQIDGNGVAQIRDYEENVSVEMMDATVMGVAYEQVGAGITSGTLSLNCYMDPADTNGQEAMTQGASVTVILRPDGTGSGLPQSTYPGFVENIVVSANPREHVNRNFTVRVSGTVNRAAQP